MSKSISRILTLKYGYSVKKFMKFEKPISISVGRVMTCVLGMVVRREREIRAFVKTPFYRVIGNFGYEGQNFDGEWRAVKGSKYFESPLLYKENGFKEEKDGERGKFLAFDMYFKSDATKLNSYNSSRKAYVDFINKLNIALKEADETAYWLELLYESGIIDKQSFDSMYNDLKEIIALLTSSIKNCEKKRRTKESKVIIS